MKTIFSIKKPLFLYYKSNGNGFLFMLTSVLLILFFSKNIWTPLQIPIIMKARKVRSFFFYIQIKHRLKDAIQKVIFSFIHFKLFISFSNPINSIKYFQTKN